MKVLYLYSGLRRNTYAGIREGSVPDTQLYGLNHMHNCGIEAEYRELVDILPAWLIPYVPFSLRHVLLYFTVADHDIVFGSSLLYTVFFQKIWKKPAHFILLNLGLSRTLRTHERNSLRRRLICVLLRQFSMIVCLSSAQKKILIKEAPFLKNKIQVIPLGVDSVYHTPSNRERSRYILSVGRDNGRDYKTVTHVAKLMPEREFVFVCSKRNLIDIVVPSNVRVYYDISYEALRVLYQEAHLLVLTTHDDTFIDGSDCSGQTVLLDAFANSLPVIVSYKRYLIDYVEDGVEAIVVPPYDSVAVRQAILQLDTKSVWSRLSTAGRACVETKFSTVHMTDHLCLLFKDICTEKI